MRRLLDYTRLRYGLLWVKNPLFMIAEWLITAACVLAIGFAVYELDRMMARAIQADKLVQQERQKSALLEASLVACLNGGVIAKVSRHVVACKGAEEL